MSDAEEIFAFHLKAAKLPEAVREFRFHPARKWRFDFAWPAWMVAVEIEGGVWSGGRHVRGKGFVDDCAKYNQAALLGWSVFRFPVEQVSNGEALKIVEEALNKKGQAWGTKV